MHRSARLPRDLRETSLSQRLAGADAVDLTLSNPTEARLPYPWPGIRAALGDPGVERYAPDPLGARAAREAVAAAAGDPGLAERLVLTAGTSEAYAFLFKLLADPGEAVAVPRPGYPLFDALARLEGVRTLPYALEYDRRRARWRPDRASLEAVLAEPVRAVVSVNPSHPTGEALAEDDARWLLDACGAREVPLVSDEVFAHYPFEGESRLPSLAGVGGGPPSARLRLAARPSGLRGAAAGPLVFVLDGLSKRAGLPQLKLAWIAVHGEAAETRRALEDLAWIADAYLSVSAPVQAAAARLFALTAPVEAAIRRRVQANRRRLAEALAALPAVELLGADGGWYAVLRVPGAPPEEEWCLALAERFGVRVHPGFFYDFESGAHLVVSLLAPEFEAGLARLVHGLTQLPA
jgi:aspartate/methionine/tyrosine aminotransferase